MQTITISKLQKNISLLSGTTESIQIFNGTKWELIGTFVPKKEEKASGFLQYAGIGKGRAHLGAWLTDSELVTKGREIYYQKKYGTTFRH